MYAVVDIAGKQLKISANDKVLVPTLKEKPGSTVKLERVILLGEEKQISIGNPFVAGATVEATILGPVKGDRLTVFKKKKRKGYRVKRGHRQGYTEIQITKIQR